MTNADREDFAKSLAVLCAASRVDASEPLLEGYWLGLRDLPIEAVKRAMLAALQTSERLPAIVEIRRLAGGQSVEVAAVHAWMAVKRAMREHGAYASVDFGDPVTHAVIRALGGWIALCGQDSEELDKWTRKEFVRMHGQLAASGSVPDEERKHLGGLHEASNGASGHRVEPPKRIAIQGQRMVVAPTRHLRAAE